MSQVVCIVRVVDIKTADGETQCLSVECPQGFTTGHYEEIAAHVLTFAESRGATIERIREIQKQSGPSVAKGVKGPSIIIDPEDN